MNSSNALVFLVLGSLMNALPALAPSIVSHGLLVEEGLTESALWLHLMGLVVGIIGSSRLLADGLLSYRSASRMALSLARSAVNSGRAANAPASSSLQTA